MELTFRKATAADLPALLRLIAQLDLPDEQRRPGDFDAVFRRILAHPDYTIYKAESEGALVATASLLIVPSLAHSGAPGALIENMVVDETYRNRGVGQRLLAFVTDKAVEAGCYKIALSSSLTRSGAHRFYEGRGYRRYGYAYELPLAPPGDAARRRRS